MYGTIVVAGEDAGATVVQRHALQQIVGPQPNPSAGGSTVHCALFNKTRFIVYASGSAVEVYTGNHAFVQSLQQPLLKYGAQKRPAIRAVSMSGVHGMIVAATDASLLLFRPADDALDDSNVHSHSWLFDHAIDVEESTASLSWSPNGELLAAGGKCLSVWNLAKTDYDMDLKVVWRLRSPFRVQRVEFGPDGKFFFSLAEGDRHLKLWFPSVKDPGRFDFLYLRHPCVVANAEWRRPRSRNEISSNVLLTTGDDGVSRIWCQNGKVFPHQFEMRAIIDPPLDTMQEEETRRSRINQPIRGAFLGDSPQYIDVPILHWLPGAEIEAAIDYTEVKEDTFVKKKRKSATSLRRSKRLRDVMKDYPDMLFWIGFDGSITIWGIQFLNGSPRRVPKVLVVLKNNAAVLPVDYDMFRGAVQIYHDNRSLDRASIYFPAELQVLAMAPSGLLGSYRMNLEDFFGSTWANSYLKLEHFWPGHRSTVARFFRHPRLPYIGTSSEDGEINFYRFEAPQKSIRSKEGLDLLSKLDSVAHEQQKFLSWLPDRPCAIVASNDEIYLDELNLSGAKRLATLSLNSDSACFAVATFALCSEAAEAASKYWAYIIRPRLRSVVLLEISFIGLSFQSSEVLKTFEVEELRPDVVEIAPLDEWTSRFGPGIEGGPHQFVSQSKDGYVDVWSLCDVAGFLPSKFTPDLVWKRTMATKIESTKALVKSDCSGDFVLASSKGSDSVEIFIYTPGSIRFKSGPFAKVTASSDIVDMAIHLSSDAQVFLAVSTHAGVDVYCFDRITESGTSLTLRRVSESVTGWDSKIYKICWLFDGSLALALEDKVVVMSKWLSDRPIPLGSVPNSIHSCVVKHNGRLPEYHPFLLTHYLVWGKYDRVKYFLSFLHKYVRLMRSNDRAVDQVPSVLWQFFEDANTANRSSAAPNYDSLFTVGDEDHIPEAPIGDFTIVELTSLTDALATMRLPWLSEEDQLKLLAIMDTFVQIEPERRSLDDNGVRFVLFAKLFIFARKFGKADDIPSTVSFRDVAWAFYSDSQEHLVDFLSEVSNGKPTWTDAKSLGMGFWLKNVETLRKQVETFARNQYMGKEDRDPVDCSLFYITLKKKNVLLGLWKLATNHPEQGAMVKFLGNDFAEERWQKAAVKNAFALLGKQRYEYAAAFFLLGERLKDAASVCLKQLNDPQLAIVLCRLVEGDESPILKDIVENSLLSDALREGNRWLASICFSFLGDKSNSVYATYLPLSSLRGEPSIDSGEVCQEPPFDPSIFLLYEHLHKYYRAMRAKIPPASAVIQREFICDAVQTYDSMGCPTLSLEISADFFEAARAALGEETQAKPLIQAEASTQSLSSNQKAEDFDWSTPVSGKAQEVDWSAPVSQKAQDFDWGPPASSVSQKPEDFDWSAPVSSQPSGNSAGIDWGEPVGSNSFDDDYGKFKKSLFANTAEDEDLVDEDVMVEEAEERETISPSDGARESELAVDPVARLSYELSIRCMRRLRWLLVFRIIHVIDQSAACISKNLDVLSPEETFKNYFTLVGSGLQELCRFADMKPELLEHLIISRCKEMDTFLSFLEIPRLVDNSPRDGNAFASVLLEGSNQLAEIALRGSIRSDSGDISFMMDMAKRMLWSITRWHERYPHDGTSLPLGAVSQAAATAFLALAVCCARQSDMKGLWWITGLSDRFFEVLVGGGRPTHLKPLIVDLLAMREPTIPPASDSEEDLSEGELGRSGELRHLAGKIIRALSLLQVGVDLSVYLTHLKENPDLDEASGFLSDVVLKSVSIFLSKLRAEIWTECANGAFFDTKKMAAHLEGNSYGRGVWSLLKRTANVRKMLDLLVPSASDLATFNHAMVALSPVAFDADSGESSSSAMESRPVEPSSAPPAESATVKEDAYEVVFRTKEVIGTFAINPLDHNNFAVATHQSIIEVDIESSLAFFERRGSFSERRESIDDFAVPALKDTAHLFANEEISPDRTKIPRNLSFDSLQRAVKKSMANLRQSDSIAGIDSGQRIRRKAMGVSALEAHPSLNYYVAGISENANVESVVKLFQFGQQRELVSYSTSGSNARLTRCRFDPFGTRFGASDMRGNLKIWKFDASQDSLKPVLSFNSNSAVTNDFVFLSSATLLATAGISGSGNNIGLWDTLMPTSKARVKAFSTGDTGAYCLGYSHRHRVLLSGGKKGEVYIFDIRQRCLRKTVSAHSNTVKSLSVDDVMGNLVSASTDGEIKTWDLNSFLLDLGASSTSTEGLARKGQIGAQVERSSGVSSYGTMQVAICNSRIFSCGVDGSLRRSTVFTVKPFAPSAGVASL